MENIFLPHMKHLILADWHAVKGELMLKTLPFILVVMLLRLFYDIWDSRR